MPQLTSSSRKWAVIDSPPEVSPPGRIGHTFCANAAGTKAYVYGGVNDLEDSTSNYLNDLWEYDVATKRWTEKALSGVLQHPRAFHTAVWHGDRMYIFGGCNGHGRFNKLFTIDAEGRCEPIEFGAARGVLVPDTRYCHSAVVFEGCMYVFGGKCGGRNSNRRLSDLFYFSFAEQRWRLAQQHGQPPAPRSAHTALTHGRTMIVFGGRNSEGECCEDFYLYHFDTCVWQQVRTQQPNLFGRARNSAVVHFGNVFVFGGWNGKKKLNDLFVYNVEGNVYEFFFDVDRSCPSRRECHVAVMCGNTMVVFGGRFRGTFMTDTAELFLGPESLADAARDWLLAAAADTSAYAFAKTARNFPLRLRDAYIQHAELNGAAAAADVHFMADDPTDAAAAAADAAAAAAAAGGDVGMDAAVGAAANIPMPAMLPEYAPPPPPPGLPRSAGAFRPPGPAGGGGGGIMRPDLGQ